MKGAFIISRKIFDSDIWLNKPATWLKIWIYILGNVNHDDKSGFKRGEGFFMFSKCINEIGNDITRDIIKKTIFFLKKNAMISTTRSTRGMLIKVSKYEYYQTLNNYTSTELSTKKALRKHQESTPINKNDKNDKNDKYITSIPEQSSGGEINKLLDIFYSFNNEINYGNRYYRKILEHFIKKYGFEKTKGTIEYALSLNNEKYAPVITNPTQLKAKFGDLLAYYKKHNQSNITKL